MFWGSIGGGLRFSAGGGVARAYCRRHSCSGVGREGGAGAVARSCWASAANGGWADWTAADDWSRVRLCCSSDSRCAATGSSAT